MVQEFTLAAVRVAHRSGLVSTAKLQATLATRHPVATQSPPHILGAVIGRDP